MSKAIRVPCTIDVANTVESLHAHVELHGIDVGPGDGVLVHGAPVHVARGERVVCDGTATVTRAGRLRALWTRMTSRFELALLYEVGFSGPATHVVPRRPR